MRERGFTLLEFIVASAIAGIVTVGIMALLRGQIAGYDPATRARRADIRARRHG